MNGTVTVVNEHGTFSADAAVVERLLVDHGQRNLPSMRNVLEEIVGTDGDHYSDVNSRIEIIVMLADTLPPMRPSDRRNAGIKALVDKCFDKGTIPQRFTPTLEDIDDLKDEILDLQYLGRARRWKDAVVGWANLIEAGRKEDVQYLRWAIIQGGIMCGHEAE